MSCSRACRTSSSSTFVKLEIAWIAETFFLRGKKFWFSVNLCSASMSFANLTQKHGVRRCHKTPSSQKLHSTIVGMFLSARKHHSLISLHNHWIFIRLSQWIFIQYSFCIYMFLHYLHVCSFYVHWIFTSSLCTTLCTTLRCHRGIAGSVKACISSSWTTSEGEIGPTLRDHSRSHAVAIIFAIPKGPIINKSIVLKLWIMTHSYVFV